MSDNEIQNEKLVRYREIVQDPDFVMDRTISVKERVDICRRWLYAWELKNIEQLRETTFSPSRWRGKVTLLIHSFQPKEEMFYVNEFPILHTWKMLGSLPVVIVTDQETSQMSSFRNRFPSDVSIRTSLDLKRGDVLSLSRDCLMNMDKYFSTPYCLIIQDDGFPIRDNLDEFLGKWDYVGAPCVRDLPRQYIADLLLKNCLNGGFCLRSHSLCAATTRSWHAWGSRAHEIFGWTILEDWFYSIFSRYNPIHRFRFRFPWASQARRFSFMDLMGAMDVKGLKVVPFGLHGPTTIYLYRDYLRKLGYKSLSADECLQ